MTWRADIEAMSFRGALRGMLSVAVNAARAVLNRDTIEDQMKRLS